MLQTGFAELELLAIQKKYGRFNWTLQCFVFSSGTWSHSLQLHLPHLHYLEVVCWDMWCMIALTTTCTMDNHPQTQQNISRWGPNASYKKSWISHLLHGNVHKVLIPWNFAWYAEVSLQPSLQNPRHGLWHYLIALGRCLWDIASIHDTWEEELTHITQFLAWKNLGDL